MTEQRIADALDRIADALENPPPSGRYTVPQQALEGVVVMGSDGVSVRCPECGADHLIHAKEHLWCAGCGFFPIPYPKAEETPNLLTACKLAQIVLEHMQADLSLRDLANYEVNKALKSIVAAIAKEEGGCK